MSDPLISFRRFRAATSDDVSAALLTLAAVLSDAKPEPPLSVKQAAARRGVSPDLIRDKIKAGELRHHRLGRAIRISPSDLDAL
jgi:excisionase family DNA binding protein